MDFAKQGSRFGSGAAAARPRGRNIAASRGACSTMVVASHGSRRNSNSNSNRNRQPLRSTSNTGGASRGVLGDGMGTRVKSRALTHGGGGAGLTGARKVDRFSRPSARLTQQYGKVAALGRSRAATPFSRMYQGGGAPFRIDHGCNRNQLAWNCPIDEL